jgi:peptidoglycan/xylan/chitin deacetylase (PgdA/CDA1 family)
MLSVPNADTASSAATRRSLYLLYHEVRPQRSDYTYAVDASEFSRHLKLFRHLRDASSGDLLQPEITFDDGHLSNFGLALPALAEHNLFATFFITAGWTENRPGYMNWTQLRALKAAGHRIGAHGLTHALLTHCNDQELQQELAEARLRLEDGLGDRVDSMSLPGGRYNARVIAACRAAGYTQVFTSRPQSEPIPAGSVVGRLNIRSTNSAEWVARVLDPSTGLLAQLERGDRMKSGLKSLLGDRLYAALWGFANKSEASA